MTNTFTPTTNAFAIPTIIAQEVIKLLPANLGLAKFISKDTDWTGSDFATYGDTLNIVKPGSIAARTKTPGTAITVDNATATKVNVTLDTHAYVSVLQEDITKLLQKPDLQAAYAQRMAIVLAEKVETSVMNLHPSVTNTVTWNRSSATTVEQSFLAIREKFSRLKVSPGEAKGVWFEPGIITDLLQNQKYSSGDYVNQKVVPEGAVRRIYNMDVYESQLIPVTGSPVAYHNFATTKWGLVLVSRPMPLDGNGRGVKQYVITDEGTGLSFRITEGYDQQNMGVQLTIDLLYGCAVADVNQVIEVESF